VVEWFDTVLLWFQYNPPEYGKCDQDSSCPKTLGIDDAGISQRQNPSKRGGNPCEGEKEEGCRNEAWKWAEKNDIQSKCPYLMSATASLSVSMRCDEC